jgi:hypothetical protein
MRTCVVIWANAVCPLNNATGTAAIIAMRRKPMRRAAARRDREDRSHIFEASHTIGRRVESIPAAPIDCNHTAGLSLIVKEFVAPGSHPFQKNIVILPREVA